MLRRLLTFLCLALMASTPQAIEEPGYQVLQSDGAFELRQYEPVLLAQVEVDGDAGAARSAGFRLLAGYIFGANQGQRKIAMTAPVTQVEAPAGEKIAMTAPVTQSAAGPARWRVAFTMPRGYTLETLPLPDDARVQFVTVPGEKRAVIRFDGFSTEANLGRHRALLQAWVQRQGLKPAGEYVAAFYNDPFTLPWNRRNEWWVAVE
jgi:SOUL heme-binding protein